MRAGGAAVQGALAVAGLLAAYTTWRREPEKAGGDVVVLDLGRGDLERVRYDDPPKWVELERGSAGADRAVWIRIGTREVSNPDGGVAAAGVDAGVTAKASAEPKVPDREVRGNELAEKLYDKFAPIRASRALGTLDEAKLRELGLETSKKRLEVIGRGGKKSSFVLSMSALGAGAPYLENEQDKRVYLLGSSIVSDLDAASTRLVDRRLHTFKQTDYDSLVVKVESKQRELVQISPEGQAFKIASKKFPDKPDDFARNWHDKIWHLIVTEVLGKGEAPASGEPATALRVEYKDRGKPVGWIELAQSRAAGAAGSAPEMFARTEHTAGWVKVHATAEDLLKEGKKIAAEQ